MCVFGIAFISFLYEMGRLVARPRLPKPYVPPPPQPLPPVPYVPPPPPEDPFERMAREMKEWNIGVEKLPLSFEEIVTLQEAGRRRLFSKLRTRIDDGV